MTEESEKCNTIRKLLEQNDRNEGWYDAVADVLSVHGFELKHAEEVMNFWNSDWGELGRTTLDGHDALVWARSDGGPAIYDATPRPINEKLIHFCLQATLTVELNSLGLVSYIQVGIPKDWRRCRVYINGKPQERVIWACALSNRCEIMLKGPDVRTSKEEPIPSKIESGHVIIRKEEADLGFF